ncbi:MAG: chemotaxis protein CheB [bacterium]|nr:chemotaxis protein CheB [bacterium]
MAILKENKIHRYKMVVIGVSAGGINALSRILEELKEDFPIPIVIVQHLHPEKQGTGLDELFNERCRLKVTEAGHNETIIDGNVYFAPPAYHILIEDDGTFSLSADEKVNFARPSIDVLFESAADVYQSDLIGVILTGANNDGAIGLKAVKDSGGLAIVQNPETAEYDEMPDAAINNCDVDHIISLSKIPGLLNELLFID